MSELGRLILPLDMLTGLPLVLGATPLNYLLLFIAIPGLVAVIIGLIVKVSTARGRSQASDAGYNDPVWYGPEPTGGTPGHDRQRAAVDTEGTTSRGGGRKGRGGASARW